MEKWDDRTEPRRFLVRPVAGSPEDLATALRALGPAVTVLRTLADGTVLARLSPQTAAALRDEGSPLAARAISIEEDLQHDPLSEVTAEARPGASAAPATPGAEASGSHARRSQR